MKTDDLIRALAADTTRPRALGTTLLLGMAPSLAVALLAVWLFLGFRADLSAALVTPASVVRILLTGALGVAGACIALRLARPGGESRAGLWPLWVVAAAALGLLSWAYATTPEDARGMATVGKTMTTCLVAIPLLSILPVAALHRAIRQGATTAPALAGFVAGLSGSGLSAAVYALYCMEDSPLFYVTWYGLAILSVAVVSTLVGVRTFRW